MSKELAISQQEIKFSSELDPHGIKLAGRFVYPEGRKNTPGILFLHGSGKDYGKDTYSKWQEELAKLGLASFAFDFMGVGESDGAFADNTLNIRVDEAYNALEVLRCCRTVDPDKIALMTISMGSHVGVRVLEMVRKIKAIAIQGGAAYPSTAENCRFNKDFTEAITKPEEWKATFFGWKKHTPIFSILEAYQGKVLVIYAQGDEVIPQPVQECYREIAEKKGRFRLLPATCHRFLRSPLPIDQQAAAQFYQEVNSFFLENF